MAKIPNSDVSYHHSADIPQKSKFHRHMHNDYEILFFVSGDADYIIEGSVYHLEERDLLFIPPRTFHYLIPKSEARYERFVLNFSKEDLPTDVQPLLGDTAMVCHIPKDSSIERFFIDWRGFKKAGREELLVAYLHCAFPSLLLFLDMLTSPEPIAPIRKNNTLDTILRYIDTHPWEKISAASLSAQFYMSSSWIVHTFQRELGISLMQYVSKKRILYAQSRIKEGISPTEAAKECSYDSYVTFYRQYKRILLCSPHDDIPKEQRL